MPPLNTGLLAQLGFAQETTYGTYVAATRFLDLRATEAIKLEIPRIASQAIRAGKYNKARPGAYAPWRKGAKGPLELEVANKGFGLLFKNMLGAVASSQPNVGTDPTVWQHTATVASLAGTSMTIQLGRPDLSTGVLPFSYKGAKFNGWELSAKPNELCLLKLDVDAQDEDTTQSLVAATPIANLRPYSFLDAVLNVGGSNFDVREFVIKGANNLATQRYFARGLGLKKEQLDVGRDYTIDLIADFDTMTAYNRFINATEATFTATWTGPIISTTRPYSLTISGTVRADGETPGVSTMDVLPLHQPCVILDDTLSFVYQTTDTSP